jgi:hypothetical protein
LNPPFPDNLFILQHGPDLPVTRITYPPFKKELAKEIIKMLESHGCRVDVLGEAYIVIFPDGTMKREIYPRTQCERYKVILPDGFLLMTEYDPYRNLNLLFLMEDPGK